MTVADSRVPGRALAPLLFLAVPLAFLGWAYWTTLAEMAHVWSRNSSYSHGWLVPVFAVFLLYLRRELLDTSRLRPSLFGPLLLGLGIGVRLFGTFYFFEWLDPLSLLPCLAGVVLMVGGWHGLRWAWPACVFLFFMIPLPYSLSSQLSGPLQHLATLCSTYLMQLLGMPALSEGNTIRLNEAPIDVGEACSGLRMLMVFFALSSAVALLIKRPWAEKVILVASAIPIALAVNILRITATGLLHEFVNSDTANAFFHDIAGWFMMPLALVLLWGEYKLLTLLHLPPDPRQVRSREAVARKPTTPRAPRTRAAVPPTPRERNRPATPRASRKP